MAGRTGDSKGGRGWGAVIGLALVTVAFSVVHPALLIFVPLSLLLLALPPWRPHLVALGIALAAVAFFAPADGPLWYVGRGWGLVLGAWFLLTVLLWPGAGFLSRAFAALGAATASAAVLLSLGHGWGRLDWTITQRFQATAVDTAALLGTGLGLEEWSGGVSDAIYQAAELEALLYPALLALASLAGLGVAWWAYRRLSRREHRPLAPFREFRFRDEVIWLLIAGIVLVLIPTVGEGAGHSLALRAGSNVLTFVGALYALRGAAVVLALVGAPGIGGALLGAVIVFLLYPLVLAGSLLLGVTDTWIDLRARGREARRSG